MLFVAFILSASQISKDAPWPRRYCASALRNVVSPTRWRPTTIIRTGLRSSLSVSKGIQPFPFSIHRIVQVQNPIFLPVLEAQRQHRQLDVLSRRRAQPWLLPGLLHAGPHEDIQVQGLPLEDHDHRRIDEAEPRRAALRTGPTSATACCVADPARAGGRVRLPPPLPAPAIGPSLCERAATFCAPSRV